MRSATGFPEIAAVPGARDLSANFVALGRPEGQLLRYPAFRWVFPIFYLFGTGLFVGLFVYQLAAGGHP